MEVFGNGDPELGHRTALTHDQVDNAIRDQRSKPVGRPQGSCKLESERRVSLTVRVKPDVAANIKKLPKGHLRKHLENLYG